MEETYQRQTTSAISILQRLPSEVVFHFWGIVLVQAENSFQDFNKILQCVPELRWSVKIVTDDIQRCAPIYRARDGTSPRILTVAEFQSETKSPTSFGKLIRRVFVSFGCEEAVRTGELSAYEGCRYACLFSSPFIDASYCLVAEGQEGHIGYTEGLLSRFQMISNRHMSSSKLHIVSTSGDFLDSNQDVRGTKGDFCDTVTISRCKDSGQVLDHRSAIIGKCIATDSPYGNGNPDCSYPLVLLTYKSFAPHVHVSFTGTRIPIICYTEGGYASFENIQRFNLYYRTRIQDLKRITADHGDSKFSVSNLSWSVSTPQGAEVCEHAMRDGYGNQEGYNRPELDESPKMRFANLYKRVWYYGIPDSFIRGLAVRVDDTCMEEFVWFRLSLTQSDTSTLPAGRGWLHSRLLKRLAIFTELRKRYNDLRRLPRFSPCEVMDCVQLVALEHSDQPWDGFHILPMSGVQHIRSLEVLQLRNSSARTTADPPFLRLDWDDINYVSWRGVQELTIGGYVPAFAFAGGLQHPSRGILHHLKLLSLDVSTLISEDQARLEELWYELCFPELLFPCLAHLYLKGVASMSLFPNSYPKLSLPKTCTTLSLSSVIRTKALANNQLLEIPNIPVVADTFNRWELSKETDGFVYDGTGYDNFTRRVEKEIDKELRPI